METSSWFLRALGRIEHARCVRRERDPPVSDRRRRNELDAAILAELTHTKTLHATNRFHPREVTTVARGRRVDGRAAERETLNANARRCASEEPAFCHPPD